MIYMRFKNTVTMLNRTEQNRTEQACVDGTIKEPKKREVANVVIDRSRRESGKTH